jgi:hypothetical protein
MVFDSDYKDHSLNQLKEMVDDALNSEATPQEVRDSIVNTIREQIDYHLKCIDKASEFLALLKHHDKIMPKEMPQDPDFQAMSEDDRNSQLYTSSKVTEAVTQKDWEDFWSPSSDRELVEVNENIKKEGYEYTPPTSHNKVTQLPTRY